MTDERASLDGRLPGTARFVVAATLLAFGATKLLPVAPSHQTVRGLAGLLSLPGAGLVAATIEIGLGLGLLSPVSSKLLPAVVIWLASLFGITAAFLVGGVAHAGCGCLGPITSQPESRAAMLGGLLALSYVAMRKVEHREHRV